jgi:glycosyltransferase involved in cell wall biosynthesis
MTISAVILARNEEHNIRYCLETVRWCDEIVVVDMESTDHTMEIAREYTDRIFSHPTVAAFDIAKKYAVEQAQGKWILLIDADEMVPPALADSMKLHIERNDADVFKIPFKHYILGDWVQNSGWGYSPLPRLFRVGSIRFEKTIHGYMHVADTARVEKMEPGEGACIIHFNYTDSRHFVEKLNRYTSVEAEHLYEKGEHYSYFALLSSALRVFHGRYIKGKGYKDGVRGFALSMMMVFYNVLTHIKLWELHEFKDDSIEARYDRLRDILLDEWNKR